MQVIATQSAAAFTATGSTFSSTSRTSTSGGVRPASSGRTSGGASTLPPPHQPCDHAGAMMSSLGLFVVTLVSQSAPQIVFCRQAGHARGEGRIPRLTYRLTPRGAI